MKSVSPRNCHIHGFPCKNKKSQTPELCVSVCNNKCRSCVVEDAELCLPDAGNDWVGTLQAAAPLCG